MTAEQWVSALALTESDGNMSAWGDGGRAVGRFQVHPDWLWTWALHYKLAPTLNETWDHFIMRVVTAFAADHLQRMFEVVAAMYFHLGHVSSQGDQDWDESYADRFRRFAAQAVS